MAVFSLNPRWPRLTTSDTLPPTTHPESDAPVLAAPSAHLAGSAWPHLGRLPLTSLRASPNGRGATRLQLGFEILHQPITEKFIPPALSLYAATHVSAPRGGGGGARTRHAHTYEKTPKVAILTKVSRWAGALFVFRVPRPRSLF